MKNPKVDAYLSEGCGRCPHYQTPQCKVHNWQSILKVLRELVLETGLKEDYKWSQPCYTWNNKNVLIVSAFKEYAFISFFKGSLLPDPDHLLTRPGKSSQAARQLRFTRLGEIEPRAQQIQDFIQKAIALEEQGAQVAFKKHPEPLPEELIAKFSENPSFQEAFERLTAGRQRGYVLYFSQAKQSKTRLSRIEKCQEKIMRGQGLQDPYRSQKK